MQARAPSLADAFCTEYVEALLGADVAGARRVLDRALEGGLHARDLYLYVLQPALYEIGARWSRAEISVAQEHLATATTQSLMSGLAARLERESDRRGGRVAVACAADEMHALGPRMVADFLEADGWDVMFLGALTPPEALAEMAVAHDVDIVAVSAALPERIPHVARATAALRALERPPFILAGGQAFAGVAERALAAGADAYAPDAAEASRLLAERFR